MCGILAAIGPVDQQLAKKVSKKMGHRGPDESGYHQGPNYILCHERLSIIDLTTGKQPIQGSKEAWVIHNGEIYNHQELRSKLKNKPTPRTTSDSEIIVHLYEEMGKECIHHLDGVFAFVLINDEGKVFAGRDPIGVKPLFWGKDEDGVLWFASEYKSLIEQCEQIEEFLPGHYYTQEEGFVRYYEPSWWDGDKVPSSRGEKLKDAFEAAVRKRLMSDVPLGVLLSGGLDSSLVASIVAREMKKEGRTVKSFSVGFTKESQDLKAAKRVADMIGTEHHEIVFTIEDGLKLLEEIVWITETYDITTIRAATPMLLMSKYIKDQGVKVVLSGEGADEIFGGYLYFRNAPTSQDFHSECVRRVKLLHTADVLRADRATMGAGIEARVPFLDKEFLDVAMNVEPSLKTVVPGHRMEKHVLREAFDDKENPYLPADVLWRQKEQFSDGVGYSWIDTLKELGESKVSDEEFATREERFPHNTPSTKEAFYYRCIYERLFPHKEVDKIIHKWIPRWQKDLDPSGRANSDHVSSYYDSSEQDTATCDLSEDSQETLKA